MARGNTTHRDRLRSRVARGQPPCSLCGGAIDYTLRFPDPMCFTVDHVIPIDLGGEDNIDNAAAAHFRCNRIKSNKVEQQTPRLRTFETARVW